MNHKKNDLNAARLHVVTHRQVALQRGAAEVLVHLEAAVQQLLEVVPTDAECDAHADGRPEREACHTSGAEGYTSNGKSVARHAWKVECRGDGEPEGVAASNPVPELEHVVDVDAKFGDFLGRGAERDEVLGDGGCGRRM